VVGYCIHSITDVHPKFIECRGHGRTGDLRIAVLWYHSYDYSDGTNSSLIRDALANERGWISVDKSAEHRHFGFMMNL
jgi:hypothetical protein